MKILFASSEAVPYCKTGGLADVVGALTLNLAKKGHQIVLVLPLYKEIDRKKNKLKKIPFPFKGMSVMESVPHSNMRTYFVDRDGFFNRKGLYGYQTGTSFNDNHKRYSFYSQAVLDLAKFINFQPNFIHCHDWQTGLIPVYLKYFNDPFFKKTKSLFSIHNMIYQGNFPKNSFQLLHLPTVSKKYLKFGKGISFLKGGLSTSTYLNTVSPTYKKEILTQKEFGGGLEGVLNKRKKHFFGILNGLDVDYWNPEKDPNLIRNFSVLRIKNRIKCKLNLQQAAKFKQNENVPLLGFVGRLDRQKGIDVLLTLAPKLARENIQMVFLGKGDKKYQSKLRKLSRMYSKNIFVENRFAEKLAHKIYGGCDLFLMPSLYEPCGLGQLIAMRYGALPVVMPTGGLKDTVIDVKNKNGTGFVARDRSYKSYESTLKRALLFIKSTKKRKLTQARGMRGDYSWNQSLKKYLKIYEK